MKFGDICRVKCGAPARYLGEGKALYVSAMCNDLGIDEAVEACGGEVELPLPSNNDCRKWLKKIKKMTKNKVRL